MNKAKHIVNRILEVITCSLTLIMAAAAIWQAFSRYVLRSPSVYTEEFLRFSVIWLALLGAAYVTGKRGHIAVTVLEGRLPQRQRYMIDIINQILFIAFALAVLIFGGFKAISISLYQYSAALQLSMALVYLALPVSGLLIIFYSIANIFDAPRYCCGQDQGEK